jgi:hypothetical protein
MQNGGCPPNSDARAPVTSVGSRTEKNRHSSNTADGRPESQVIRVVAMVTDKVGRRRAASATARRCSKKMGIFDFEREDCRTGAVTF